MSDDPRLSEARHFLINGQHISAWSIFQVVLEDLPANVEALRELSNLADEVGRHAELVVVITRALEADASNHFAYYVLGCTMFKLRQFEAAAECFDSAIALDPSNPYYFGDRGNALLEAGLLDRALCDYSEVISLDPRDAQAYWSRGNALLALGRMEDAIADFDRAIALAPTSPAAYLNRGNALLKKQQPLQALESFNRAIELQPHYPMALSNRSAALKHLHRLDEALLSCEEALRQDPGHTDAQWNRALILLVQGDLFRGFMDYQVRWNTSTFEPIRRNFAQPIWLGSQDIQGKRLLIHNEQGFGDSIQFSRFVTLAHQEGAEVVYEVEPALHDLMCSLAGVHTLVRQGDQLPHFDYYCPVMSLPVAFGTTLETVPRDSPYLFSSASKRQLWEKRLGTKLKIRVGLAWSGSTTHQADQLRSIALAEFMQALPPDIEYVSLQKDVRDGDRAALTNFPGLRHFGDEIRDFSDTAALCDLMDVVIAVDTSVAHLAGALGVKTWVLLPHFPDWRWLMGRSDSPWYPTMQLFRQETAGEWAPALAAVRQQLLGLPG